MIILFPCFIPPQRRKSFCGWKAIFSNQSLNQKDNAIRNHSAGESHLTEQSKLGKTLEIVWLYSHLKKHCFLTDKLSLLPMIRFEAAVRGGEGRPGP